MLDWMLGVLHTHPLLNFHLQNKSVAEIGLPSTLLK